MTFVILKTSARMTMGIKLDWHKLSELDFVGAETGVELTRSQVLIEKR